MAFCGTFCYSKPIISLDARVQAHPWADSSWADVQLALTRIPVVNMIGDVFDEDTTTIEGTCSRVNQNYAPDGNKLPSFMVIDLVDETVDVQTILYISGGKERHSMYIVDPASPEYFMTPAQLEDKLVNAGDADGDGRINFIDDLAVSLFPLWEESKLTTFEFDCSGDKCK